jgi:hypothetical protein
MSCPDREVHIGYSIVRPLCVFFTFPIFHHYQGSSAEILSRKNCIEFWQILSESIGIWQRLVRSEALSCSLDPRRYCLRSRFSNKVLVENYLKNPLWCLSREALIVRKWSVTPACVRRVGFGYTIGILEAKMMAESTDQIQRTFGFQLYVLSFWRV